MKKRFLTLLLVTTMVCGLFTACGGNNDDNENASTNNETNQSTQAEDIEVPSVWNTCVDAVTNEDYNLEDEVADSYVFFEKVGEAAQLVIGKNSETGNYTYRYLYKDSQGMNGGGLVEEVSYSKSGYIYLKIGERMGGREVYFVIANNKIAYAAEVYDAGERGDLVYLYDENNELLKGKKYTREDVEAIVGTDFIEIEEWYTDIESAYKNRIIFE